MIINLEVPLELFNTSAYGSYSASARNLQETQMYLNPSNYDGATYYFEIVARNNHASNAYEVVLYNKTTASEIKVISIPANTTLPIRIRSDSFNPAAGNNVYTLLIRQTAANSNILCYTARIVVVQADATKTRIQIPISDSLSDSSGSYTANANYGPLWLKNESAFADIAAGSPWSIEATGLSITTIPYKNPYFALFNKTTGQMVTGTEQYVASSSITLVSVDFSNTATNFTNNNIFEIREKTSLAGNNPTMYKANLYVKLTNLTKAEVFWKIAYADSGTAATAYPYKRALANLSNYSLPKCYFEVTGSCADNNQVLFLRDHSTNDQGTNGSNVADSGINFNSTTKAISRTGELTLTDDNRYYLQTALSTAQKYFSWGLLVIACEQQSEAPEAPVQSDPTDITDDSITWNWADVANETGYRVYDADTDIQVSPDLAADVTTWKEEGLDPGTTYNRYVTAFSAGGESLPSNEKSALTIPAAPTPAASTGITDDIINWNWDNVTGETGYRMYDADTDIQIGADIAADTTTVEESGLDPGTTYNRYFTAFNANGESAHSTTKSTPTTPDIPTGLTHTANTASSITWDWDDVVGATGYKIYRVSDDAEIGDVVTSTWLQQTLSPNTQYSVYVKAYNGSGTGTKSANVSVYTSAALPVLAAFSGITPTVIQANWTANSNPGTTNYYCENTTNSDNSGWVTDLFFNNTGLTAETTYTYRVKAKNGDGDETAWVALGSETTLETPIGRIKFYADDVAYVYEKNDHDNFTAWIALQTKVAQEFGVMFRITDKDNAYRLLADNDTVSLQVGVAGVWTDLDTADFDSSGADYYYFKIVTFSDHLYCYIGTDPDNLTIFCYAEDSTYTDGKLGVFAHIAYLDYLYIKDEYYRYYQAIGSNLIYNAKEYWIEDPLQNYNIESDVLDLSISESAGAASTAQIKLSNDIGQYQGNTTIPPE
jgi:hypothetical protein